MNKALLVRLLVVGMDSDWLGSARIVLVGARTPRLHATGIENYMLRLASFLKEKGIGVEIWGTSSKPQDALVQGIQIREFWGFSPNEAYHFSWSLFRALRKESFSIVHANGYNNLVTVLALLAKKPGQKLVVTMNSSGASTVFRKALRVPFGWVFGLLARRLDKVICVSQNELDIFQRALPIPKERFALIPNGVERRQFEELKVKKKEGQLILIGRMVKNKGHYRVLNALSLIVREKPGTVLHLVGNGPLEKELKKKVSKLGLEKHVVFHGSIPFSERPRLLRLLKESQAMILLSDYEGNALVFSEALAARVPMILSEKGVMKEYVKRKDAVGIREVDNPKIVAETVLKVLENPSQFLSQGPPPLDWDEVGSAVLSVYRKLLVQEPKRVQ